MQFVQYSLSLFLHHRCKLNQLTNQISPFPPKKELKQEDFKRFEADFGALLRMCKQHTLPDEQPITDTPTFKAAKQLSLQELLGNYKRNNISTEDADEVSDHEEE